MSRKDTRSHKKQVNKDKEIIKKWEQNQLESAEDIKVICPHPSEQTCYRCLTGAWLKNIIKTNKED